MFIQKQLQMTLYRIKNIAEVATLCHYDIRLLRRTTVESVCLLSKQKPDAYLDIEITAEERPPKNFDYPTPYGLNFLCIE